MATNVFFDKNARNEQLLYEDLVIESLGIYGFDVAYIPRSVIRKDEILNEEYSQYESSYMIEMYPTNIQGFEGQGNLLSKFGLEIREQATFVVSRRRFEQMVDIDSNRIETERPREGDLIYFPLSKSLFEITFVEHQVPFYQLQNLPVYQLQCELFEFSEEKFDTGVDDIDIFENLNASQLVIEIEGGTIGFRRGEKIQQTLPSSIIITGEVSAFEETQKFDPTIGQARKADLYLINTAASDRSLTQWQENIPIVSLDDAAKTGWVVNKLYTIEDIGLGLPQDSAAQNEIFENDGNDIIDFDESNPFGEPRL